jgi:hypothetical protein
MVGLNVNLDCEPVKPVGLVKQSLVSVFVAGGPLLPPDKSEKHV